MELIIKLGQLLFSTQGRINRSQWWAGQLLALILAKIILVILHFSIPHTITIFTIFSIHNLLIGAITGIFLLWVHFILNMKRWHDLNKKGWWTIFNYIPIIGFFVTFIVLGLIQGQNERNEFGEIPHWKVS